MASSSRKRVQYTIDVCFSTEEEKGVFTQRLKDIHQRLSHSKKATIDNHSLVLALFDAIDHLPDLFNETMDTSMSTDGVLRQSFLQNSGKFLLYLYSSNHSN